MKEAYGDFWDQPAEVHVITTNGDTRSDGCAIMGRGIAREAKRHFRMISKDLGGKLLESGNHVYYLGEYPSMLRQFKSYNMFSFPVKHHWYERADIDLIVQSTAELVLKTSGMKSIVMVRPGCGNGNLDWAGVKSRIKPMLDDRFTIIERGVEKEED